LITLHASLSFVGSTSFIVGSGCLTVCNQVQLLYVDVVAYVYIIIVCVIGFLGYTCMFGRIRETSRPNWSVHRATGRYTGRMKPGPVAFTGRLIE